MNIKILEKKDYTTTNWSGGTTSEVYIYPEDEVYGDRNFNYRISTATVELDKSEFTSLDNIERYITPLDAELKLTHDGKDYIELDPFEVYQFNGGLETTSYGRVRDFNLMLNLGTRGKMYNADINSEINFTSSDKKHILIFTYDKNIEIDINNEAYSLDKFESLHIELASREEAKIKIEGQTGKVLVAEILI